MPHQLKCLKLLVNVYVYSTCFIKTKSLHWSVSWSLLNKCLRYSTSEKSRYTCCSEAVICEITFHFSFSKHVADHFLQSIHCKWFWMVPVFAWFWGINWLQVEFFILLNYTRRNMWKICLKILTWQCGDSGTALMVTFFTVRDCSWRPPWLFFEPCSRYWMHRGFL